MTLGENLVRLRAQKNWSQGDLADALDVSRQSVSKWETGLSHQHEQAVLRADHGGGSGESFCGKRKAR